MDEQEKTTESEEIKPQPAAVSEEPSKKKRKGNPKAMPFDFRCMFDCSELKSLF